MYEDSGCEWIFGGKLEKERCGAYGAFTLTNDLTPYTKAALFRQVGKKTHVLLTFSEVYRWAGFENCGRTCAYSIKFYTADGIWDLVGCNHPVAFACHPRHYSDAIASRQERVAQQKSGLARKWDTWSLLPDSLHQIMYLTEDCENIRNYRYLHGFGCRTYQFVNNQDRRFLVKFHFLSQQHSVSSAGKGPGRKNTDYFKWARHDLYDSIRKGNYPKWKLYLQMMPREDAGKCPFNPYDPTKTWPQEDYPLMEAGTLELNSNPQNDAHEMRHCNFNPFNLVPGIELPDDGHRHNLYTDYYRQPGNCFRRKSAEAQRRFIRTVTTELSQVPEHIRLRAVARFYQADEGCGREIARELRTDLRLILEEVEWQKEMENYKKDCEHVEV